MSTDCCICDIGEHLSGSPGGRLERRTIIPSSTADGELTGRWGGSGIKMSFDESWYGTEWRFSSPAIEQVGPTLAISARLRVSLPPTTHQHHQNGQALTARGKLRLVAARSGGPSSASEADRAGHPNYLPS